MTETMNVPVARATRGVKRIFSALVIGTLVVGSAGVVWSANRPEVLPVGSAMPELRLETNDGPRDITSLISKRTVVVLYDRHCEHCRAELTAFDREIDRLAGNTVVLVTTGPQTVPDSAATLWPHLLGASNVVWSRTSTKTLASTWGLRMIPSILVFAAPNRLVNKYVGETKLDLIFPRR